MTNNYYQKATPFPTTNLIFYITNKNDLLTILRCSCY